jgi:phage terminase large subunit
MSENLSLDWNRTRVYRETWAGLESEAPVIVNSGGSRSSKTYSIIQCLVKYAYLNPGTRISVVSRTLPHLKKGAYRDFEQMYSQGIRHMGSLRLTDLRFTLHNGSYLEFFGLENPDKAHGPGRDILFINEANYIPITVYRQLAQRTTGKILLDLNPSQFNSWVYDVADDPRNIHIHSTYRDNPFVSPQQIKFIEDYQNLPDPFMWQVYGLGLRGASEEIIYRGWQEVDCLPDGGEPIFGLDFGYTHPSALVEVRLYEGGIYVHEHLCQDKLTKPELTEKVKDIVDYHTLYCDAAEPDSIEELCRHGVNAYPANKDVWSGIVTMKSMPVFYTRTSHNLKKEYQSYRWKKDRNGLLLEEPVKENDHLIDALRYAVHSYYTGMGKGSNLTAYKPIIPR